MTTIAGRVVSTVGKFEASFVEDRVDKVSGALNLLSGFKIAERDLANPLTRATVTTERVFQQTGQDLGYLAQLYADGQATLREYNEGRSRVMTSHFAELQDAREDALAVDLRVDPSDKEAVRQKTALLDFARQQLMGPELASIEAYYQMDLTDRAFQGPNGLPDQDKFFKARDQALETVRQLAGDEKAQKIESGAYLSKLPEIVQKAEADRKEAFQVLERYGEIPRYLGFSVEEGKQLKSIIEAMGLARNFVVPGAGSTKRAYLRLIREGAITAQEARLAQLAQQRPNPQRSRFRHIPENARTFYDLFSDLGMSEDLLEGRTQLMVG